MYSAGDVDDADQLLKFREDISKEIKQTLTQKAKEFNVAVEDVSFMHLGFSREYSQAIEQKAVQQQLAEKQKCIVARDEELKTAQIIRSEAEAESAKLINNAVKNFGAAQIEIKRLEAAKIIAELMARNPNISFVPDNSNNLLNLRI